MLMLFGDLHGANTATYQRIFDAAPMGIIVVEKKTGDILLSNSAADRIFGYNGWGLAGRINIDQLVSIPMEDHKSKRQDFEKNPHSRPMAERKPLRGLHANGHSVLVQVELAPTPIVFQEKRTYATIAYVQEVKDGQGN